MERDAIIASLIQRLEYLRTIGIDYIRLDSADREMGSACKGCEGLNHGRPVEIPAPALPVKVVFVLPCPFCKDRLLSPQQSELMQRIAHAMGLSQEDYHITALVRCPVDREPAQQAIENCLSLLDEELERLKPLAIVTMGDLPLKVLAGIEQPSTAQTGRFYTYRGIKLMPVVHPQRLIEEASLKRDCWMALKKVMALYG